MDRLTLSLLALAFCASPTLAQDEDDPPPKFDTSSTRAGPVEFHVMPEIGVGVFLEDDQVIRAGGTDAFFLVRIPGLRFPGINGTVTGIQVEFSQTTAGALGIQYDILSYTRTKIAGGAYTGANIRIVQGASEIGAAVDPRIMPVVGLKMWTVAERVPFFLEVEFLDNNRPLKASLIITWR